MKRFYPLLFFILLPALNWAQGEAANWFFGTNAVIDFNTAPPRSNRSGALDTAEGCSSISDSCGNLLFYSDGTTVWNRFDNVMVNGTGLFGNSSAAQSAVIVPDLDPTNSFYYIFTVGEFSAPGVYYSVVDMDGDNGRGEVIVKNLTITGQPVNPNSQEKITAVIHADGDKFWLMTYDQNNGIGNYRTYIIQGGGVDPTSEVISSFPSGLNDARGSIKFSPDGRYVATTSMGNGGALLADFDNATGQVTNQRVVTLPNPYVNAYGVEFSAQSNVLYIDVLTGDGGNGCDASGVRAIASYDMTATNGHLSPYVLPGSTMAGENRGALQLGIDQRIYVARPCEQFLAIIDDADIYRGEDFRLNGLRLAAGTQSREGLPPFITSFFTPGYVIVDEGDPTDDDDDQVFDPNNAIFIDLCDNEPVNFRPNNPDYCPNPAPTFEWDFDDGSPTVNTETAEHTFTGPGTFNVTFSVTNFNFTRSVTYEVVVYESAVVANPIDDPLYYFDFDDDGSEDVDLIADAAPTILGPDQDPADFDVTFHNTLNEANNGQLANPQPQTFLTGSTPVFARVQARGLPDESTCYKVEDFEVIVVPAVEAQDVTLIECDDDDDGLATFNLEDPDVLNEIASGAAGAFTITFHETLALAQSNGAQVTNPSAYLNEVANNDVIFIRMQDNSPVPQPTTFAEATLIVAEAPVANPVTNNRFCDVDNDGTESVDLDQEFTSQILDTQSDTDFLVTYHNSQFDADEDQNEITAPIDLTGSRLVYVRIDNVNQNECADTSYVINLELDAVPIVQQIDPYRLCDDETNNDAESFNLPSRDSRILELNPNPADFIVRYYDTLAEAEAGDPNQTIVNPGDYPSGGQIIYVRVENINNPGCFNASMNFELIVDDRPIAQIPTSNLEFCDDVSSISLSDYEGEVLGNQTNSDFEVTFYDDQNEATAGTPQLGSSFDLQIGVNTLFARIDNTVSDCLPSIVSFDIVRSEIPEAISEVNYRLCDTDDDGQEVFILDSRNTFILDGQNENQFTITYYETEADARSGTGTLAPNNYPLDLTTGTATVFARIENVDNSECASADPVPVNLFIDELPEAFVPTSDLEFCDDVSSVDLTNYVSEVLAGQTNPDFEVRFYDDVNEANAGGTDLGDDYPLEIGVNTLFARVANTQSTCPADISTFDIVLSRIPARIDDVDPYRLADCDGDETEVFILSTRNDEVLDGQDSNEFRIEYFETEAEAQSGTANGATALSNNYPVTGYGSTTVWARIENVINTECAADPIPVNLLVDEIPETDTIDTLRVCDDDGQVEQPLSDYDDQILASSNPDFRVTYHRTQAEANSGDDPLTGTFTITPSTPGIFARAFNTNHPNACPRVVPIEFELSQRPEAGKPDDLVVCDDPGDTDLIKVVDLSQFNDDVYGDQDQNEYDISYYASSDDADNRRDPLDMMHPVGQNGNAERIFARIESVSFRTCGDIEDFLITVTEQPSADLDLNFDQTSCDNEPFDNSESFVLGLLDEDVLDGQDELIFDVSYYASEDDALNRRDPLPKDGYSNISNPQTIFVRIENSQYPELCANTDISFTLTVFDRPEIRNQGPITICAGVPETLDAGPGFASYEWSTGEMTRTIDVVEGGQYTVTVFNDDGCDSTATIRVRESDIATITEVIVEQFEVKRNKIKVRAEGPGSYIYSLDDFVYQEQPLFDDLRPGFYEVFVKDENGCGTVSEEVVIIGGPAFFTPNQDGYNDTWQIIAGETVPDARVSIFDRYGKLITSITAGSQGWDGTFNGTPLPSTDYWYTVELEDGRSFKGHFALKR